LRPSRLATRTTGAAVASPGTVIPAGGVPSLFADAALLATEANAPAAAKAAPIAPPRSRFLLVIRLSFQNSADAVCAARIDEYVEERIRFARRL
jgi:hypothetical protein